ncbi:hypothetical protein ACFX15_040113 [Malus domestica]
MYNPYSNIIWQLAIHATNQVKNELIFMPPTRQCEAKPIYGVNKSFINEGQPQLLKASHTLDHDSVKQNQFMVLTRASSMEGNHNSQKLHTLLIKTV